MVCLEYNPSSSASQPPPLWDEAPNQSCSKAHRAACQQDFDPLAARAAPSSPLEPCPYRANRLQTQSHRYSPCIWATRTENALVHQGPIPVCVCMLRYCWCVVAMVSVSQSDQCTVYTTTTTTTTTTVNKWYTCLHCDALLLHHLHIESHSGQRVHSMTHAQHR